MEHKFTFISSISSSTTYTPETKFEIIAFAMGNPVNKTQTKLSKNNENLLGFDIANLLTKRHNDELQRCSQFYSLASIYNETSTKDKHQMKTKNIKKIYSTGRKYIVRFFICS
ncbi:unnamed protein product [Rotaria sp. Silwood2]|nr:unnamed protein product [Rotaria sp. Silwood2]CAF2839232.1 unnamed protein product [Rotaria sp. Silwood2]CAF3031746.1 unnamed protein product [Rotaria sp. Silwood2]CAF3206008.1 unnamed protein product [Rotaria sp. Silwood2]CAF3866040.1 unnamed protein product [Rotaria sp. Silwood2]